VQSGLNLARDVRIALVERKLAEDRLAVRTAIASTWTELARIGAVRARVGDSSPAESASLQADAAVAFNALQVSRSELTITLSRLRATMGVDGHFPKFQVVLRRIPRPVPQTEKLIGLARQARPDVRAGELSVRSALARVRWERSKVVSVAAQVEGHWRRPSELAARVGGRIELPLFSANPGGIGRADAEVARSVATLNATRQRVVLEIVTARTRAEQAIASLDTYGKLVVPPLEDALQSATRNYELGEETYLLVLDATRRLSDARLRQTELTADWRRAFAELECAVGARLETSP
jgi:cobalt-zinc-cadmium efflux system outer membrane protein